jgi:hypothetical protein
LRPSRADARRALSDLERALDLRALAFRARHGDAEAKERLRENAAVAADALDGGAAASAAASRLEAAGDAAAAAAIRAAAAPEASALGALSALLQEAALAEADGGRALSVDVVAAAAHGKTLRRADRQGARRFNRRRLRGDGATANCAFGFVGQRERRRPTRLSRFSREGPAYGQNRTFRE